MLPQDTRGPTSNPTPNPPCCNSLILRWEELPSALVTNAPSWSTVSVTCSSCCIQSPVLYTEQKTICRSPRCYLIPAGTGMLSCDVGWNPPTCRRLSMHPSQTMWVLLQLCYGKRCQCHPCYCSFCDSGVTSALRGCQAVNNKEVIESLIWFLIFSLWLPREKNIYTQ